MPCLEKIEKFFSLRLLIDAGRKGALDGSLWGMGICQLPTAFSECGLEFCRSTTPLSVAGQCLLAVVFSELICKAVQGQLKNVLTSWLKVQKVRRVRPKGLFALRGL